MHEHRRQQRDQLMTGTDLGRDHRPFHHERLAALQLHNEDDRVHQDDGRGDDRPM